MTEIKTNAQPFTPGKTHKPKAKYENPKTANEAVRMMEKMCHKLARKWTRNHTSEYDDIYSEGMVGVVTAWNKFNGSEHQAKGYRFTSYAFMWARACMKGYAETNWKRLNHLKDGDISEMFDREEFGYEPSEGTVDLQRRMEKLSDEDYTIFSMRTEGYTFKEIAKTLEKENLHQVRNRFLELVEAG